MADIYSSGEQCSPQADEQQHPRKKRVRHWSKEDRAKHREFEKGRREAFNESLMDLAKLILELVDAKQPGLSKHVVVQESLKHHQTQQTKIDSLMRQLESLTAERDGLLAEVIQWRQVQATMSQPVSGVAGVETTEHPELATSCIPTVVNTAGIGQQDYELLTTTDTRNNNDAAPPLPSGVLPVQTGWTDQSGEGLLAAEYMPDHFPLGHTTTAAYLHDASNFAFDTWQTVPTLLPDRYQATISTESHTRPESSDRQSDSWTGFHPGQYTIASNMAF